MRVMLAEKQSDVRSAVRLLITHTLGMQVVGEIAAAANFWTQMQDAGPDLLLLEWGLLGAEAGPVLTRLRAQYPGLQIIVLSGHGEARPHALAAGADAFVSTADAPEQLVRALRAAQARGAARRTAGKRSAAEEDAHA
jgi:two-component system, NarL family, invasion response regulator UvrY